MSGWSNYSCTVISQKMNESEMGNRGSKSEVSFQLPQPNLNEISVKEQRVDGSYFGSKSPKLRCTLMDCENSFQFKIPSKQLNKKFYSSLSASNNIKNLNPWFITGFTDAEGCFTIKVQHNAKLKTKWRIRPVFSITLNSKDLNLLESIKNTAFGGVGSISKSGKSVIFAVESVKDLPLIINHFDKYPLITQKISDYLIFKQCYDIIIKNEHLTEMGLLKILSLKSSLNLGLPDSLKLAFPNIISKDRPEYFFNEIPDPFWVSGFTSGDGSFHVVDVKNKGKTTGVLARFSIHLHLRDLEVLKGLSTYFKSINSNIENTKEEIKNISISEKSANFQISKFSDVTNIIIPFFNKYPILGVKSLDFEDFKKICSLMQTKNHLNSVSELDKILEIKSNMNLRRKIK